MRSLSSSGDLVDKGQQDEASQAGRVLSTSSKELQSELEGRG